MSKIKKLVNRLNNEEYQTIFTSLQKSEATKSAELLKYFRDNKYTDNDIKKLLDVNDNAYYTLRSRLNDKIESFILEQSESPRTSLLKQVSIVLELILTKNKAICVNTLKKLEKELNDYDLSNELVVIYKALKKLHINEPEYFEYSQLYNRHVASMLAVDKAEEQLATYFIKYAEQKINYSKDNEFVLEITRSELLKSSKLYKSHRMLVYATLCDVFYLLTHNGESKNSLVEQAVILQKLEELDHILNHYKLDPTYHNLKYVIKYLQLIQFFQAENWIMVDELLEELQETLPLIVSNYSYYTNSAYLFDIKLARAIEREQLDKLRKDNQKWSKRLDWDSLNEATKITIYTYFITTSYISGNIKEVFSYITDILQIVNSRNYPKRYIDIKLFQTLLLAEAKQHEEVEANLNNIQRHIRLMGKDACEHSYAFLKVMRSCYSEIDIAKKDKKVSHYLEYYESCEVPDESLLKQLKFPDELNEVKLREKN